MIGDVRFWCEGDGDRAVTGGRMAGVGVELVPLPWELDGDLFIGEIPCEMPFCTGARVGVVATSDPACVGLS